MSRKKIFVRHIIIYVSLILAFILVSACKTDTTSTNIVGRWEFESYEGKWDYRWMEFFEDGTYTDNWGNSRTWIFLSDGRLKLTSNLDGYTFLYDVNLDGSTLELSDEYGNKAKATRMP